MRKIILIIVGLSVCVFAGDNRSGFYLGAGAGGNGAKGYLGYQFNNAVGIELDYSDYSGEKKYNSHGVSRSPSYSSLSVAANIGYSFLDSQIRPFFKIGYANVAVKYKYSHRYRTNERNYQAIRLGIGFQYEPNLLNGVGFRIAYETDADVDDLDNNSDLVYLAIQYKF